MPLPQPADPLLPELLWAMAADIPHDDPCASGDDGMPPAHATAYMTEETCYMVSHQMPSQLSVSLHNMGQKRGKIMGDCGNSQPSS